MKPDTSPLNVERQIQMITDALGAPKGSLNEDTVIMLRALSARVAELEATLAKAVDMAAQAIAVIDGVQTYEQPYDPTEENALTMCEHEVFDFDVQSARATIAELKGGTE